MASRDYMVNVGKHPYQAPIILTKVPKICNVKNEINHRSDWSILTAFFQLRC